MASQSTTPTGPSGGPAPLPTAPSPGTPKTATTPATAAAGRALASNPDASTSPPLTGKVSFKAVTPTFEFKTSQKEGPVEFFATLEKFGWWNLLQVFPIVWIADAVLLAYCAITQVSRTPSKAEEARLENLLSSTQNPGPEAFLDVLRVTKEILSKNDSQSPKNTQIEKGISLGEKFLKVKTDEELKAFLADFSQQTLPILLPCGFYDGKEYVSSLLEFKKNENDKWVITQYLLDHRSTKEEIHGKISPITTWTLPQNNLSPLLGTLQKLLTPPKEPSQPQKGMESIIAAGQGNPIGQQIRLNGGQFKSTQEQSLPNIARKPSGDPWKLIFVWLDPSKTEPDSANKLNFMTYALEKMTALACENGKRLPKEKQIEYFAQLKHRLDQLEKGFTKHIPGEKTPFDAIRKIVNKSALEAELLESGKKITDYFSVFKTKSSSPPLEVKVSPPVTQKTEATIERSTPLSIEASTDLAALREAFRSQKQESIISHLQTLSDQCETLLDNKQYREARLLSNEILSAIPAAESSAQWRTWSPEQLNNLSQLATQATEQLFESKMQLGDAFTWNNEQLNIINVRRLNVLVNRAQIKKMIEEKGGAAFFNTFGRPNQTLENKIRALWSDENYLQQPIIKADGTTQDVAHVFAEHMKNQSQGLTDDELRLLASYKLNDDLEELQSHLQGDYFYLTDPELSLKAEKLLLSIEKETYDIRKIDDRIGKGSQNGLDHEIKEHERNQKVYEDFLSSILNSHEKKELLKRHAEIQALYNQINHYKSPEGQRQFSQDIYQKLSEEARILNVRRTPYSFDLDGLQQDVHNTLITIEDAYRNHYNNTESEPYLKAKTAGAEVIANKEKHAQNLEELRHLNERKEQLKPLILSPKDLGKSGIEEYQKTLNSFGIASTDKLELLPFERSQTPSTCMSLSDLRRTQMMFQALHHPEHKLCLGFDSKSELISWVKKNWALAETCSDDMTEKLDRLYEIQQGEIKQTLNTMGRLKLSIEKNTTSNAGFVIAIRSKGPEGDQRKRVDYYPDGFPNYSKTSTYNKHLDAANCNGLRRAIAFARLSKEQPIGIVPSEGDKHSVFPVLAHQRGIQEQDALLDPETLSGLLQMQVDTPRGKSGVTTTDPISAYNVFDFIIQKPLSLKNDQVRNRICQVLFRPRTLTRLILQNPPYISRISEQLERVAAEMIEQNELTSAAFLLHLVNELKQKTAQIQQEINQNKDPSFYDSLYSDYSNHNYRQPVFTSREFAANEAKKTTLYTEGRDRIRTQIRTNLTILESLKINPNAKLLDPLITRINEEKATRDTSLYFLGAVTSDMIKDGDPKLLTAVIRAWNSVKSVQPNSADQLAIYTHFEVHLLPTLQNRLATADNQEILNPVLNNLGHIGKWHFEGQESKFINKEGLSVNPINPAQSSLEPSLTNLPDGVLANEQFLKLFGAINPLVEASQEGQSIKYVFKINGKEIKIIYTPSNKRLLIQQKVGGTWFIYQNVEVKERTHIGALIHQYGIWRNATDAKEALLIPLDPLAPLNETILNNSALKIKFKKDSSKIEKITTYDGQKTVIQDTKQEFLKKIPCVDESFVLLLEDEHKKGVVGEIRILKTPIKLDLIKQEEEEQKESHPLESAHRIAQEQFGTDYENCILASSHELYLFPYELTSTKLGRKDAHPKPIQPTLWEPTLPPIVLSIKNKTLTTTHTGSLYAAYHAYCRGDLEKANEWLEKIVGGQTPTSAQDLPLFKHVVSLFEKLPATTKAQQLFLAKALLRIEKMEEEEFQISSTDPNRQEQHHKRAVTILKLEKNLQNQLLFTAEETASLEILKNEIHKSAQPKAPIAQVIVPQPANLSLNAEEDLTPLIEALENGAPSDPKMTRDRVLKEGILTSPQLITHFWSIWRLIEDKTLTKNDLHLLYVPLQAPSKDVKSLEQARKILLLLENRVSNTEYSKKTNHLNRIDNTIKDLQESPFTRSLMWFTPFAARQQLNKTKNQQALQGLISYVFHQLRGSTLPHLLQQSDRKEEPPKTAMKTPSELLSIYQEENSRLESQEPQEIQTTIDAKFTSITVTVSLRAPTDVSLLSENPFTHQQKDTLETRTTEAITSTTETLSISLRQGGSTPQLAREIKTITDGFNSIAANLTEGYLSYNSLGNLRTDINNKIETLEKASLQVKKTLLNSENLQESKEAKEIEHLKALLKEIEQEIPNANRDERNRLDKLKKATEEKIASLEQRQIQRLVYLYRDGELPDQTLNQSITTYLLAETQIQQYRLALDKINLIEKLGNEVIKLTNDIEAISKQQERPFFGLSEEKAKQKIAVLQLERSKKFIEWKKLSKEVEEKVNTNSKRHSFDQEGIPQAKSRAYLVHEWENGIVIREDQKNKLEALTLQDTNTLEEFRMGLGKSSVVFPLAARLLLTQGKFPIMIFTEELIEQSRSQMDPHAYIFDFGPQTPSDPLSLTKLYHTLLKVRSEGRYVMTTVEREASLQNRIILTYDAISKLVQDAPKFNPDTKVLADEEQMVKKLKELQETLEVLQKIENLLLRDKNSVHRADEADEIYKKSSEKNFAKEGPGNPSRVDEAVSDTGLEVFKVLYEIDKFKTNIPNGKLALLSEEERKEIALEAATKIYDKYNQKFSPEFKKEDFVAFVVEGTPIPDKQWNKDNTVYREAAAYAIWFRTTLPTLYTKQIKLDFDLDKEGFVVTPRKDEIEKKNNRFGEEFELAGHQYLYYLQGEVSRAAVDELFQILLKKESLEWTAFFNSLNLTPAQKNDPEAFKTSIYENLKKPENATLRLEVGHLLMEQKRVVIFREQIERDAQAVAPDANHLAGASGTMNRFALFPVFTSNPEGTEIKEVTAETLTRIVLSEGNGVDKQIQTYSDTTLSEMKRLAIKPEIKAIINQGSPVGGYDTRLLIEELRKENPKRQYVFIDNKVPYLWDIGAPNPVPFDKVRDVEKINQDQVLYYFGPSDTRGTDFKIPFGEAALFIGPTTTTNGFEQAAWRCRELGTGHNLKIYAKEDFVNKVTERRTYGEVFKFIIENGQKSDQLLNDKVAVGYPKAIVKSRMQQLLFTPLGVEYRNKTTKQKAYILKSRFDSLKTYFIRETKIDGVLEQAFKGKQAPVNAIKHLNSLFDSEEAKLKGINDVNEANKKKVNETVTAIENDGPYNEAIKNARGLLEVAKEGINLNEAFYQSHLSETFDPSRQMTGQEVQVDQQQQQMQETEVNQQVQQTVSLRSGSLLPNRFEEADHLLTWERIIGASREFDTIDRPDKPFRKPYNFKQETTIFKDLLFSVDVAKMIQHKHTSSKPFGMYLVVDRSTKENTPKATLVSSRELSLLDISLLNAHKDSSRISIIHFPSDVQITGDPLVPSKELSLLKGQTKLCMGMMDFTDDEKTALKSWILQTRWDQEENRMLKIFLNSHQPQVAALYS